MTQNRTELGSEVLRCLGRTSPQWLNADRQTSAMDVKGLCDVLEGFQSFDDLRRDRLEILKDSFLERRDQLQLGVQILEASSVLGIRGRCAEAITM